MPVFHVYLNRKRLSTVGINGSGVLTAIVNSVVRTPVKGEKKSAKRRSEGLNLELGGLDTTKEPHEHVSWIGRKLKVGDEVLIRLLEDGKIDRPRERKRSFSPQDALRAKKRLTREFAKELGWMITTR